MKLMLLISTWFISSSHPLSMIMTMILATLYINIIMYTVMKHSWFPLIITLLMLGGLLVIFLYITSLTPNKKFSFNKKILLIIPVMIFFTKFNNLFFHSNYSVQTNNIFSKTSTTMLIFLLMYLMITLISIMMIIKSSMAPLKSN
uniref:NADH dehydrogenase subunit 6 n=1 Tax=Ornithodoros brasiliensis TaxID=888526 RepID=W0FDK6_ORNBR|nr:NADH dehydrogenase subunit 6 [Ornithodoros brasiliensis]AHF21688.1 NADH dehydrogenase subunit 6 [Ornithodoros brasiliensis]QZP40891.1 NADH dehydrogenase subunit 6 [Ornithodoros brasiliensis]